MNSISIEIPLATIEKIARETVVQSLAEMRPDIHDDEAEAITRASFSESMRSSSSRSMSFSSCSVVRAGTSTNC